MTHYSKARKSTFFIRKVLILLGIVIGIYILFLGIKYLFYTNFYLECPQTVDVHPNKKRIFLQINLTNKNEINDLSFYFYETSRIYILKFDGQDWVKLYFKKEPYIQLKYLPRLIKTPINYCRLIEEINSITGIPINDFIIFNNNKLSRTNLKPIELAYFYITQKLHKKQSLTVTPTLKAQLPDSTPVRLISYEDIQKVTQPLLQDETLLQEGIFVEVYNATQKPGYATLWARRLKTLGINILRAGNSPYFPEYADFDVLLFRKDSTTKSKTYSTIKMLLKGKKIIETNQRPQLLLTTGDIVIILLK